MKSTKIIPKVLYGSGQTVSKAVDYWTNYTRQNLPDEVQPSNIKKRALSDSDGDSDNPEEPQKNDNKSDSGSDDDLESVKSEHPFDLSQSDFSDISSSQGQVTDTFTKIYKQNPHFPDKYELVGKVEGTLESTNIPKGDSQPEGVLLYNEANEANEFVGTFNEANGTIIDIYNNSHPIIPIDSNNEFNNESDMEDENDMGDDENECEPLESETFKVWDDNPYPDEVIDYYVFSNSTKTKDDALNLTLFEGGTDIPFYLTIEDCTIEDDIIQIPKFNMRDINDALNAMKQNNTLVEAMKLNIDNSIYNGLMFNVLENNDKITTNNFDKNFAEIQKYNVTRTGRKLNEDLQKNIDTLFLKNFSKNSNTYIPQTLSLVATVDYIQGNTKCNITFYYVKDIKTNSFKAKKISDDKIEYLKYYWLNSGNNYAVKDVVINPVNQIMSFNLTQNEPHANFKVYNPGNFNIDTIKFNQLLNKPYIHLHHDKLSTYLNVLLSMLDKPHDIIGSRVPCAAQKPCAHRAASHLTMYINYLKQNLNKFTDDDYKKQSITSLINFIEKSYLPKSKSKPLIKGYTYENIILHSVCQFYKEHTETCNKLLLNNLTYIGDANCTINLDLLYITTDQKNAIQINNKFSGNELIDSAHHTELIHPEGYDFEGKSMPKTIIEFPENLKIIEIECHSSILTVHSYTTYEIKPTETTNVVKKNKKQKNDEMYVVINVWFNIHNKTYDIKKDQPNGHLIRYEIPIRNAPGCAQVYRGYHINKDLLDECKESFKDWLKNNCHPKCSNFFLAIMMDQLFNAKSCQDDQNQLQVGQKGTNYSIDLTKDNSKDETDIYIGMGGDLLSAANAINYYFALKENGFKIPNETIVGYLKNNIIWASGDKLCFSLKANYNAAQTIVTLIESKTGGPKGGTKNIVQYDGRPDVLYGWLYTKENFNMPIEKIIDLFEPRYNNNNSLSDVYSIDFMVQLIKKLKTNKTITEDIIYQVSMEILNGDKIKSDNIDLDDKEIIMYNQLNEEYFNIKNNTDDPYAHLNFEETANAKGFENVAQVTNDNLDFEKTGNDTPQAAGFSKKKTIRKRTNKKRTNKKRTIRKRTIRKRTNKNKIKRTIKKRR